MPLPRFASLALYLWPVFVLSACGSRALTASDARTDGGPAIDTFPRLDTPFSETGADAASDAAIDATIDGPVDAAIDVLLVRPDAGDASFDVGMDHSLVRDTTADMDSRDRLDVAEGEAGPSVALTLTPGSATLSIYDWGTRPPEPSPPVVFLVANGSGRASGPLTVAFMPDNDRFKVTSNSCRGSPLAAFSSCEIGVTYAPEFAAWTVATLVVADTSSGATATASLQGDTRTPDCLTATPTDAKLGAAYPGTLGDEALFTVRYCSGHGPVKISTALTGGNANAFRISTNTCDPSLSVDTCVVGIQLAPPVDAKPGRVDAVVTIITSYGSNYPVSLEGMIASPSDPVLPSPSSVYLGYLMLGETSSETVTLRNGRSTATGPLTISLAGTGAEQVSVLASTCADHLAPGATCQFTVQYAPIDTRGVHGSIVISDGSASVSIAITGSAHEPFGQGPMDAGPLDGATADAPVATP